MEGTAQIDGATPDPAHPGRETAPERPPSDGRLLIHIQQLLQAGEAARALVGRTDHVTLLPNRVRFLADFPTFMARVEPHSLVLVTLAEARNFNDLLRALGHSYAEDFVRAGAARLANLLPHDTQIYHVSVLSFAFYVPDPRDGAPPPVVDEVVAAFRRSIICHQIPVDTKVGIGITPLTGRHGDPSELLRSSLAAAQDSRRGHQGWSWYDAKTDEAHRRAFQILTDMPAALSADDQFSLQYQPRISMKSRSCMNAEALLRWNHPRLGAVSPGEFIPLAEATALITPLTQRVLEYALRAVAGWQKSRPGMKISVNVSPKNLEEPDFVSLLDAMTERLGVDPALVELEFTEGMLATNWQFMMRQMDRLRTSGFQIAIDDFGSGYSNMSYLGKIPARYLKIDQAFVRPLDQERKNQLLVHAIIEMAHALDYAVVAEGIETQEAFDLLASWNCDEGQGYLMSRPLAEGPLLEWLAAVPRA